MSAELKNILVAIADPQEQKQPHLQKAAQLARRTGARLVLFHATFDPSAFQFGVASESFPKAMARVLKERRDWMQGLARSVVPRSVRTSVRVEWDYPPPEAIVREALRSRAELVIAQAGGHSLAARLLLLNNDWQLVEKCPVPLLLVKSARLYSARARILAAVDPFHVHDKPARLDRRILGQAQVLARALRGTLDVMHAYLPLGAQASVSAVEPAGMAIPAELEERHLKSIQRKFSRLAAASGIASSRRHLVSDYPAQGIGR
ncbi:MAG: universal stress protein, partial [Gammaproteobacteria bacterium]|nr:universal stress protein [Gammaproteobacteria bacterium]